MSLLLLRVVLGVAMLVEGGFYIRQPDATPLAWFLGLAAMASGPLFLAGLFTPFVGISVGVGAVAVVVFSLPVCSPNLFDSKPALIFALTMLIAIIGAGPGRYSVDAHVFGRREIIIPPRELRTE